MYQEHFALYTHDTSSDLRHVHPLDYLFFYPRVLFRVDLRLDALPPAAGAGAGVVSVASAASAVASSISTSDEVGAAAASAFGGGGGRGEVAAEVVAEEEAPGTSPSGTAAGPTCRDVTAAAIAAGASCCGVVSWPLTEMLTLTLGPGGVGRMGGPAAPPIVLLPVAGVAAAAVVEVEAEVAGLGGRAEAAADRAGDRAGDRSAAAPPAAAAAPMPPATDRRPRPPPPAPPTGYAGQLPLNQRLSSGMRRLGPVLWL